MFFYLLFLYNLFTEKYEMAEVFRIHGTEVLHLLI